LNNPPVIGKKPCDFFYAVLISYHGEAYYGWQCQLHVRTIQETLELSFSTFLRHPVKVIGASRTDRGVHAEGQVGRFKSPIKINFKKFLRAMVALLPKDIGILNIWETSEDFHPSRQAISKVYRYRIWKHESRPPLLNRTYWHLPIKIHSWEHIHKEAQSFLGEHDFSSFCAKDSGAKTRRRQIFEIKLYELEFMWECWLCSDGFLKQMIRIMIGTLIDIGRGQIAIPISELLNKKNRKYAGMTAPASGLALIYVSYRDIPKIDQIRRSSLNK